MATDYQAARVARLTATNPTPQPSMLDKVKSFLTPSTNAAPQAALGKIKALVSPGSTAGILRDRADTVAKRVKAAGG